MKYKYFLPFLLVLALAGCEATNDFGVGGEGFEIPAQVLANEGEGAYRDGRYDEAAEMFQQLKDRYPYSRYAILADLRVGDAYFKSDRYDEAILAYDDFIRMHPRNEAVPYALYQMAMVYHVQMLTPDRDPTWARLATETFQRLVRAYPQDEYAHKALPRMQESLTSLVLHEMAVGDYYFKTKKYEAAIGRYRTVLTQYPDVGFYGQALEKLQASQQVLDEMTDEEKAKRAEYRSTPTPFSDSRYSTGLGGMGGIGMP